MNKTLFGALISSLQRLFMSVLTKLKILFNPTFWTTTVIAGLNRFFTKIFSVKPRDKKDYYPFFKWYVSKKLAWAIVIILGVLSIWYITAMSPLASAGKGGAGSGDKIPTYKYNSLPLKFKTGEVRILARDKHVAYVGFVKGGRANGKGRLYTPNDELLYSGDFENSMYEGQGELFYPDGTVKYTGSFSKNLYNGEGTSFRQGGTLEYKGEYSEGLRSGNGELHNAGGNRVFAGKFRMDNIVYPEFVGKAATQAADMYMGRLSTYRSADEACAAMREINAVYELASGENSLDQEWRIRAVYVLNGYIDWNGRRIETIQDLRANIEGLEYAGVTWASLAESVSINLSGQEEIALVDIKGAETFEDVYDVQGYEGREVYIYTFRNDGLLYTFFCDTHSSQRFVMYSIEQE